MVDWAQRTTLKSLGWTSISLNAFSVHTLKILSMCQDLVSKPVSETQSSGSEYSSSLPPFQIITAISTCGGYTRVLCSHKLYIQTHTDIHMYIYIPPSPQKTSQLCCHSRERSRLSDPRQLVMTATAGRHNMGGEWRKRQEEKCSMKETVFHQGKMSDWFLLMVG